MYRVFPLHRAIILEIQRCRSYCLGVARNGSVKFSGLLRLFSLLYDSREFKPRDSQLTAPSDRSLRSKPGVRHVYVRPYSSCESLALSMLKQYFRRNNQSFFVQLLTFPALSTIPIMNSALRNELSANYAL